MKVTNRDLVILAVFSALLCMGCIVALRRINAPGEPPLEARSPAGTGNKAVGPATTPSRAPASAFVSSLPIGSIPPEYKLIVDRKLFTPLVTAPTRTPASPARSARIDLGPIPSIIPPVLPVGPTRPVTQPPVKPQPPAAVPPPAAKPPLALTGIMRLGGTKAVIENTRYGTSRIMGVGESAWGWQVTYIDAKAGRVGLSATDPVMGKTLTLKLGDKRRVEPLRSGYSDGGGGGGGAKAGGDEGGDGGEGDEVG
ncbi:MAG: hypothetical protein HZB16_12040 [Armatimonadetes bacterium]|nr:hypothetical protein [Armatimonadota bacterium]